MARARLAQNGSSIEGLLAAAFALALTWVGSRISDIVPFAPLALAERLIRLAPGDAATWAIDNLGRSASHALAVGTTLAFMLGGAALPRLTAGRDRPRAHLAGLAFALALLLASVAAPVGHPVLAATATAGFAGLLYGTSLEWLLEVRAHGPSGEHDLGRRRALLWLGAWTAGLAVGGWLLGRLLDRAGPDTAVALERPDRPLPAPPVDDFPVVRGLLPDVTPVADHYVVDIDLVDPVVEAEDWRLEVAGLVDAPASFGFSDLQRAFVVVEEISVLTCVSNPVGGPLVGNAAWTGVRLGGVLEAVGVQRGAVDVVFRCADGYDVSIPLERATEPTTLLAIGQNGRPLTQEHGFPCRVRVPSLYGMMNAKWLRSIEVVGVDHDGYWAQRGWSPIGEVHTQSRIDTPAGARAGEPTWIAGVAWAGLRRIARVEVSVDGRRTWSDAQLRRSRSNAAWTQWAYRWTPERAGTVRIVCRATDGTGRRQEVVERPPHPAGATGYHERDLRVSA
ncbi:MAG: molybdopterin-dependent oxidoreductase [Solirubrobacteraceae bacterium]